MRWLLIVVGWLFVATGVVGIVLPGLPTTPFLLLAAFCFSKGSERVHDWLVAHPRLGTPIREWREHGAISRRAKVAAGIAMVLAIVAAAAFGAPRNILLLQAGVMVFVALFIFTRPVPPEET